MPNLAVNPSPEPANLDWGQPEVKPTAWQRIKSFASGTREFGHDVAAVSHALGGMAKQQYNNLSNWEDQKLHGYFKHPGSALTDVRDLKENVVAGVGGAALAAKRNPAAIPRYLGAQTKEWTYGPAVDGVNALGDAYGHFSTGNTADAHNDLMRAGIKTMETGLNAASIAGVLGTELESGGAAGPVIAGARQAAVKNLEKSFLRKTMGDLAVGAIDPAAGLVRMGTKPAVNFARNIGYGGAVDSVASRFTSPLARRLGSPAALTFGFSMQPGLKALASPDKAGYGPQDLSGLSDPTGDLMRKRMAARVGEKFHQSVITDQLARYKAESAPKPQSRIFGMTGPQALGVAVPGALLAGGGLLAYATYLHNQREAEKKKSLQPDIA